jgi:hypothetical protein
MFNLIRGFILSLLIAASPISAGQMTLLGAGKATTAVPPTFTGAGDLSLTGIQAYWGLRAFTSATRGNKLINACNSTGGVDVGCGDMFSDATTGILVSATISGITCPGANCTVKTIYDNSGQTFCTPGACDLTQATVSQRPTLGISGLNSLPCMQFTAGSNTFLANSVNYNTVQAGAITAQPFTVSYVAVRTSGVAYMDAFASGAGVQAGFDTTANKVFVYAGSNLPTATATDGVFHAVQTIWNGASSVLYVDGSSTTTASTPGTNSLGITLSIGGSSSLLTGCVAEVSLWNAAFSGANNSTMNTNQHSTSGWNF